jgi:hypothetical protein
MYISLLQSSPGIVSSSVTSQLKSRQPLHLVSKFPRTTYVFAILVVLSLVQLCLSCQVLYSLAQWALLSSQGFKLSALLYVIFFVLADGLFLGCLTLYIGYREEIILGEESCEICHSLFGFSWNENLPIHKILYIKIEQNLLGNHHLKLFYFNPDKKTAMTTLGTYLDDDHMSLLVSDLSKFEV